MRRSSQIRNAVSKRANVSSSSVKATGRVTTALALIERSRTTRPSSVLSDGGDPKLGSEPLGSCSKISSSEPALEATSVG